MDQKAAQQVAGGVVPMRLALKARAYHQHVGKDPGTADDIGMVGIEGVEPVQRMSVSVSTGDRKRVDQEDILAGLTSRTGGDRVVLALEVEDKGGSGIVNQVRDHRADALAGAGRGAGQDMAVVIKAAAAVRCVWQVAEGKRVGRGGGL